MKRGNFENIYYFLLSMLTLGIVLVTLDIAASHKEPETLQAMALLRENSALLVADRYENTLGVFSADSLQAEGTLPACGEGKKLRRSLQHEPVQTEITAMDYCPQRNEAAVLSANEDKLYIVSLSRGELMEVHNTGNTPARVLYHPNGQELWISYCNEAYLQVLDAETLQQIGRVEVPAACGQMLFTRDGALLYAAAAGKNTLYKIDTQQKSAVLEMETSGKNTTGLALFGEEIWAVHSDTGTVTRINSEGRVVEYFFAGAAAENIACYKERAYISVPGEEKLKAYQIGTGDRAVLATETKISAGPGVLTVDAPRQRLLVAAEESNTLEVYALEDLSYLKSLSVGKEPVTLCWTE